MGFAFVRYGWDDAHRRPAHLAERVWRAMERSEARRLDPAVRLVRTSPFSLAA